MNKPELIARVADREGIAKGEATAVIDAFLEEIQEVLGTGEEVLLSGFGKFEAVERKERPGRHPVTGVPITIPPRRKSRFTPGTRLLAALKRQPSVTQS